MPAGRPPPAAPAASPRPARSSPRRRPPAAAPSSDPGSPPAPGGRRLLPSQEGLLGPFRPLAGLAAGPFPMASCASSRAGPPAAPPRGRAATAGGGARRARRPARAVGAATAAPKNHGCRFARHPPGLTALAGQTGRGGRP